MPGAVSECAIDGRGSARKDSQRAQALPEQASHVPIGKIVRHHSVLPTVGPNDVEPVATSVAAFDRPPVIMLGAKRASRRVAHVWKSIWTALSVIGYGKPPSRSFAFHRITAVLRRQRHSRRPTHEMAIQVAISEAA